MRDDDGARYHDVAEFGRVATQWGDGTVYARPVTEAEHRANPFPRYRYEPPSRTATDAQLAAAVAWWESVDWRSQPPPPLPESTTPHDAVARRGRK